MLESYFSLKAVGLFPTSFSLKGASLKAYKDKIVLENTFEYLATTETEATKKEDVKPLYMEEQNTQLLCKKAFCATGIAASTTLVRSLDVKLAKLKDVDAVLRFQTEPLLPYPIENAVLDRTITSKSSSHTLLTVFATSKETLTHHFETFKKLSITPEKTTCVPAALASFAQQFAAPTQVKKPYMILHVDDFETACVAVLDGKVLASHPFPLGFHHLAQALMKDHQVTLSEALEALKDDSFLLNDPRNLALRESYEHMRVEALRASLAFPKLIKQPIQDELLITGSVSSSEKLKEYFLTALHKTPVGLKTYEELESLRLQLYAVPIGIALQALPSHPHAVDFRKDEFASPVQWKHDKIPLITYFTLCFLTALCLFFLGKASIGQKEDKIKQNFVDLLAEIRIPYEKFDHDFQTKALGKTTTALMPVGQLTHENLLERLQFLENEIQAAPDLFPLYPNVPRVSDFLGWLATHPRVVITSSQEPPKAALTIENFTYTLVKRPEQTKKQEKYQVKVELEFIAGTPKIAREFHDALMTPNKMVDPKAEIKWNSSRDRYRTSFFLKDKTFYPLAGGT